MQTKGYNPTKTNQPYQKIWPCACYLSTIEDGPCRGLFYFVVRPSPLIFSQVNKCGSEMCKIVILCFSYSCFKKNGLTMHWLSETTRRTLEDSVRVKNVTKASSFNIQEFPEKKR